MKVIAHERGSWFLLQDNERYIFDVNIDIRPATFGVTFFLNDQEIESFTNLGDEFLNELALLVHKSFVMQSSVNFTNRFIHDEKLSNSVTKAVKDWRLKSSTTDIEL